MPPSPTPAIRRWLYFSRARLQRWCSSPAAILQSPSLGLLSLTPAVSTAREILAGPPPQSPSSSNISRDTPKDVSGLGSPSIGYLIRSRPNRTGRPLRTLVL